MMRYLLKCVRQNVVTVVTAIILISGLNFCVHVNRTYNQAIGCTQNVLGAQHIALTESDDVLQSLIKTCGCYNWTIAKDIFDNQFLGAILAQAKYTTIKPKFSNTSGPYVTLASYPSSGNTWTRLLLEELTGLNFCVHVNRTYNQAIECRQNVLGAQHVALSDDVLQSLIKTCGCYKRITAKDIFDNQFLGAILAQAKCQTIKPKFSNTSGPYVALASYPGSGNTWTRLLLEELTGIHTGSLYTDNASKFSGSKVSPCQAGVFIVKTHGPSERVARIGCPNNVTFSRAIYILRNPYDAMMADFNLGHAGKIQVADRSAFNTARWDVKTKEGSRIWGHMTLYWLTTFQHPVHVLVYEHLKANVMYEMYKVMKFLNLNVTLHQLYCVANKPHKKYYRGDKPDWLDKTKLYSREMKDSVNSNISYVASRVKNYIHKIKIMEYQLRDTK